MGIAELAALFAAAIPPVNATGEVSGSFNMRRLAAAVEASDLEAQLHGLLDLRDQLGDRVGRHVVHGVLRSAFLIEPVVLPAAKTTRYQVRWSLDSSDPRHATPQECVEIAQAEISLLAEMAATEQGKLILDGLATGRSFGGYELPLGYEKRKRPIHRADNIAGFDLDLLRHVAGYRLLLLDANNPDASVFTAAYGKKIAVKTYLTDRVLTGAHKTNREKRWEAHPDSVHFALRQTCMAIEVVLVNQLCHFEGFPSDLRTLLEQRDLLLPSDEPARCPVTLMPLSFRVLADELLNPHHGKSEFQVGHLDPLKLQGNVWADGHRPENIAWISSDGNRIQGSQSVDEARLMLRRIWEAHSAAGLLG